MHHNKNIVPKKAPVLYQTTIVTLGDGKRMELNRAERRQLKIYGANIKGRYVFDKSMI